MMAFRKGIVYLHIGTEKTGTTSLQHCIYSNKKVLLEKYQTYYPSTPGQQNHTDLALYTYEDKLGDLPLRKGLSSAAELAEFKEKFEKDFLREVAPYIKMGYNLLLSNEHLSSRGGRELAPKQKLIKLFTDLGMKVKVVVYLRPQEEFMASTYSTRIKSGGTDDFDPLAYKKKRYDYLGMLDNWASVVGSDNIHLGIFQPKRWKDKNLYLDFFAKIGIAPNSDLTFPERARNKSFSQEQIEFLRQFNGLVPEYLDGAKNELRGDVIEYLESLPTSEPFSLDQKLILEIQKYYKKDNEKLRKTYLSELDSLFEYKKSEKADKGIEPLSSHNIFAHLWKQQQARINELSGP